MRTREELPGRSPIAPGQARLTSELFADGLPEKKLQLIGMSILLILLSLGPGCYTTHSVSGAEKEFQRAIKTDARTGHQCFVPVDPTVRTIV